MQTQPAWPLETKAAPLLAQRAKQPFLVRVLHWVTALLVIGMLASGLIMVQMDDADPMKYGIFYVWHQSIGIFTLASVNIRLVVRLRAKLLPTPETIAPILRMLANTTYVVLYLLMVTVPVAGLVMTAAYPDGQGIPLFGLALPSFMPPSKPIYDLAHTVHWMLAYGFGVLIAMHLIAALRHRFFDRPENDVLKRML